MKYLNRLFLALALASFFYGPAQAQNSGTVTNHAFAIGKGAGTTGYTSLLCGSAQLAVGQAAADPICQTISGDATLSAAGALTLATVNSNVGSFGSATNCISVTVNAKGLITAASQTTCTPAVGSITGMGTGIATFLATPSSANLRAALTDETGTGLAYFQGGALGTPSSGTLTNATGLPLSGLTTQGAFTFVGNNTGGSASPTAVDIAALTTKASPAAGDYVILSDQAASGAWKKATVSSVGASSGVSSIAGNTGAFTLGDGITNSVNQIKRALNEATTQASPGNPSQTGSTGGVMMGLGSTCTITPVYSTRVRFDIYGGTFNNTSSTQNSAIMRYGTGSAPANGAALTGTIIGSQAPVLISTASAATAFNKGAIVTGLSAGTAYWFDVSLAVSSGTAGVNSLTCTAQEF